MKKSYVKSIKEYDVPFELDSKKILAAMKRYKDLKKKPTSVALDETTISELKSVAEKQGIPHLLVANRTEISSFLIMRPPKPWSAGTDGIELPTREKASEIVDIAQDVFDELLKISIVHPKDLLEDI